MTKMAGRTSAARELLQALTPEQKCAPLSDAAAFKTRGVPHWGMVDGIVMELKGFWIIGLIRILYECIKNQIQNAAPEKRLQG